MALPDFSVFEREEVKSFIEVHQHEDPARLLLSGSPFPDVEIKLLVNQILGRKIAAEKFKFLLKPGIVFPPHLNLEQASSQPTAEYKATLFSGKKFLDLTSGLGIDAWFISRNFQEATLVERNPELLSIVRHNWGVLEREEDLSQMAQMGTDEDDVSQMPQISTDEISHSRFFNENLDDFLASDSPTYDLIFLDPARRDAYSSRKFLLEDLSPNILELQDQLLKRCNTLAVKLSPLMDISILTSHLKNLQEIHIVALKNEVKEILTLQGKEPSDEVRIKAVNLESTDPDFEFKLEEEVNAAPLSDIQKYLYLPNRALLKSGAFDLIAARFELSKLDKNTHLYTSEVLRNDFPGRVLEVEKISTRELKKGTPYNIVSKNHPLKPEQIKKKYGLRDGGTQYLIFTQALGKKLILKSI